MLKRELNIWHLPVFDEGYNLFEDCRRRTVVILMNADERKFLLQPGELQSPIFYMEIYFQGLILCIEKNQRFVIHLFFEISISF